MLSAKMDVMKPLFDSVNGIHLTAYVKNQGNVSDLKDEIQNAIESAHEHLALAMTPHEISQFLAPIVLFQEDGKRLKEFKGSIGLFRTEKSFRALSLPMDIESSCIVADTFHVKPLLKWMQVDRDFLLLGLEAGSASLYQGNLYGIKHVDTVIYPESIRCRDDEKEQLRFSEQIGRKYKLRETMEWLNTWVMSLTSAVQPRLFIAGKNDLTRSLLQVLQYENTSSVPIRVSFNHHKVPDIANQIRLVLKEEAKKHFERVLLEFHSAADSSAAKGNVFAIAKAAAAGKIKKLLITDSIRIFGKMNRKNGDLKLNGHDLDHEDDDILDDIAQTVLSYGGEVTVASRAEIPRGRPILAIMEDQSEAEAMIGRNSQVQSSSYEERGVV